MDDAVPALLHLSPKTRRIALFAPLLSLFHAAPCLANSIEPTHFLAVGLGVEAAIVASFAMPFMFRANWIRIFIAWFLVTLVTWALMYMFLSASYDYLGLNGRQSGRLWEALPYIVEGAVVLVEACLVRLLSGQDFFERVGVVRPGWMKCLWISLVANTASFFIGKL
jgi:hypothetical protein